MFFRTKKLAELLDRIQAQCDRLIGKGRVKVNLSHYPKTKVMEWDISINNCHYHDGNGELRFVGGGSETPIKAAQDALDLLSQIERISRLRTGAGCNETCQEAHKKVAHIVPSP